MGDIERDTLRAAIFLATLFYGSATVAAAQTAAGPASQDANGSLCHIAGRVLSGRTPLPGVSIAVRVDDGWQPATSTDVEGRYRIAVTGNGSYLLQASLPLFNPVQHEVAIAASACDAVSDFELSLRPRQRLASPSDADPDGATPKQAFAGRGRADGGSPAGRSPAGGRPAAAAAGVNRFDELVPQGDGAPAIDAATSVTDVDMLRLLPPGFSPQSVNGDAVTLNGSSGAVSLDRGLMNERLQAIGRGDFDPATGVFAPGFAPADGGPDGISGPGGVGGPGRGGPGGLFGAASGPGGPGGGPGGFFLGGRGARAQNRYQGSVNYAFGGSALNSAPYQLRSDVPSTQPGFAQNNFGFTVGGPLKIPGIYKDTNRRTSFQANYQGSRSNNVFDQYATVPDAAMRSGDFSSSGVTLIDPATGLPFAGNQIPAARIDPIAAALLRFLPLPNLPGGSQNYHRTALAHGGADNISIRLTQNLSPLVQPSGRGGGPFGGGPPFGGPRGPGAGGPGAFFGRGGPGGRGNQRRGTSILLNVQFQYRHNDADAQNIFAPLNATTSSTTLSAPVSLTILRGRTMHAFSVGITRQSSRTANAFSGVEDVAGEAGLRYPASAIADALNWGVPNLTIAGFTGVRLPAAGARRDTRLNAGYTFMRPVAQHQVRTGFNVRTDWSTSHNNANARGTYTFTGVYSGNGADVAGQSGAGLADFLIGAPQQVSLQLGGTTHLRGHEFAAFVDDTWRPHARLTVNLGLRYELVRPYTEADGRMANLDVTPDFTAAVPVIAGGAGPFSGSLPAGLIRADGNNLGPRVGLAWRAASGTVLRGGYGISYDSGSYAAIARQLAGQPPFAQTDTIGGTLAAPLDLATALLTPSAATTNNWGVDPGYALGQIQTWNVTVTRDLSRNWSAMVGYTGTKGTDLDILRAPNRGPLGLRIAGVQPFIWESSDGHSLMNSATFQLRRRLAGGVSANATYTLAKSMDNASSLGSGGAVVAQNDQDLASEWARSNFDRRHQFTAQALWELPFGSQRRWLTNGGALAAIIGRWNLSATFTAQSGTPYSVRVAAAASDLLRGTAGTLRADYTGAAIALSDPTIAGFFNTAAFSVPAAGAFGTSPRNLVTGPSAHQLNGVISRDLALGGNRSLTLSVVGANILNTVQWAAIDSNLNSPTFGQVLAVRPMRTLTANLRLRF